MILQEHGTASVRDLAAEAGSNRVSVLLRDVCSVHKITEVATCLDSSGTRDIDAPHGPSLYHFADGRTASATGIMGGNEGSRPADRRRRPKRPAGPSIKAHSSHQAFQALR